MSKSVIALIDMDNTKVDFTNHFRKELLKILPAEVLEKADPSQYWIQYSFPEEYHQALEEMICREGFFLNMEPIPGAIEAVNEMVEMGLEVFICSAPHPASMFCVSEKLAWIKKYLGEQFLKRTIITFDKTLIHGDILIDDKPEILGENPHPTWTHVVFHAPYNVHLDTPYRLEYWKDWKDVILPILNGKLKSPR